MSLQALAELWQKAEKKRAEGAQISLSGYRYQFLVFLYEEVTRWPGTVSRDAIHSWIEQLSDAAREEKGFLTITQVKKRVENGFVSAINDLWIIYRLACNHKSNLVRQLRFRIVSNPSGGTSDQENDRRRIEKWYPEGVSKNSYLLWYFKEKTGIERIDDPGLDLFATLASSPYYAENPQETINAWVGLALSSIANGNGRGLAERVANDLAGFINTQLQQVGSLGFHVWRDSDRPSNDRPPPAATNAWELINTGESRPSIRGLRQGFYYNIPEVYDGLARNVMNWINEENPAERNNGHIVLPIFSITGRSGSGKSVALLHVLSQLRDRDCFVVYMTGPVQQLSAVIYRAIQISPNSKRVIIGIDDPYTPTNAQGLDLVWEEAARVVKTYSELNPDRECPTLISCVPVEYARKLENKREYLSVKVQSLDNVPLDITGLACWFENRTSRTIPTDLFPRENEVPLFVQLMCEWSGGDKIDHFATNFRMRILGLGHSNQHLLDKVSKILSVNRLYVEYPEAALDLDDPNERQLWHTICDESHFIANPYDRDALNNTGGDAPGLPVSGYRLSHPHIADLIYNQWYPLNEPYLRSNCLIGAIRDAYQYGRTASERLAPLWGIARTLNAHINEASFQEIEDNRQQRLTGRQPPASFFQEYLPGFYGDVCNENDNSLPTTDLAIWIELRCRAMQTNCLSPDPIDIALDRLTHLDVGSPGAQDMCLKLIELDHCLSETQKITLRNGVVAMLAIRNNHEESGWGVVMVHSLRGIDDQRLVSNCLLPLLRTQADISYLPQVLFAAIDEFPQIIDLQKAVSSYLENAPGLVEWSYVAQAALHLPSSHNSARMWAEHYKKERSACFVLSDLIKYGNEDTDAVQWGREWCVAENWRGMANYKYKNANFVLEALIDSNEAGEKVDEDLAEWCVSWIEDSQKDATMLLQRLLPSRGSDNHVFKAGIYWIKNIHPEFKRWDVAWSDLWSRDEGNQELKKLGCSWLREIVAMGYIRHSGWGNVWVALAKYYPQDMEHYRLGVVWLNVVDETNLGWGRVWLELWRRDQENLNPTQALEGQGREWLNSILAGELKGKHNGWSYVWKALANYYPKDENYRLLGGKWLEVVDETNPGWGTVWIELWHRDQENPNPTQALEDQGREWLNSILDGELKGGHNDWGYVWKEIANYAPEDEEHWLLGGKWLEVVDETNSGWGRVWLELWRRDKKKPNTTTILGDQGREWLNSILDGELKGGHNGWRYVWKELANYYPKDEEYWSLGGKWLEVVVETNSEWGTVWIDLWHRDRENPNPSQALERRGREWLNSILEGELNGGHNGWGFVWKVLAEQCPDDQNHLARGGEWLEAVDNENKGWSWVWGVLWYKYRNNEQIAERMTIDGQRWLKHILDQQLEIKSNDWGYVWKVLASHNSRDSTHLELGKDWLEWVRKDDSGWSVVFEWFVDKGNQPASFIQKGYVWCNPEELSDNLGFVFEKIIKELLNRDKVPAAEIQILNNGPVSSTRWVYIWKAYWSSGKRSEKLAKMGKEWLGRNDALSREVWASIWKIMWVHFRNDDDYLAGIVTVWLEQEEVKWRALPSILINLSKNPKYMSSLWKFGVPCLVHIGVSHNKWAKLWLRVWDALLPNLSGRTELVEQGIGWLETYGARGPERLSGGEWSEMWCRIWKRLWCTGEKQAELKGVAEEHLSGQYPYRNSLIEMALKGSDICSA